jgi:ribonuclease HI
LRPSAIYRAAFGMMVSRAMKKAFLITDGSCLGNPGPGGWACILRFGAVKKELFGYDRMEMMAAIQGLLAFKEPCEVEITTDAVYVLDGITKWVILWKRRHWWKKNRPVRNVDLWMELDELNGIHKTNWIWTKGHAAHEDNNRCDWLAQNAARTQTSCWPGVMPHASLRLDLGRDYIPPKPQASLFDAFDPREGDDDDESDPG